jgi:cyanate permease
MNRHVLVVLLVALVLAVALGIAELINSDAALVAVVTGVPVALALATALTVVTRSKH